MKVWSDMMDILFTIHRFGILVIGFVFFLFIAIMVFLILASAKKSFKKKELEDDSVSKLKSEDDESMEEVFEKLKETTEEDVEEEKIDETYKEQLEEEKNDIKSVLEKMEKDLEKEQEGDIETFEREQEEKAIISYQELLKATGKLRELTKENVKEEIQIEDIEKEETVKEEPKKFKNTEFISPVYGKEAPESVMNRKNQEFLNSLKDFRRNL